MKNVAPIFHVIVRVAFYFLGVAGGGGERGGGTLFIIISPLRFIYNPVIYDDGLGVVNFISFFTLGEEKSVSTSCRIFDKI